MAVRAFERALSWVSHLPGSPERPEPLFIVGTGRCGSSLLARICKTHPELRVYPDEANGLWHPRGYPYRQSTLDAPHPLADPAAFSAASLQAWPDGHEETLKRIMSGFMRAGGTSRKLVIKSAMVSFLIPTLLRIFPDARFVHLIRHGLFVALSFTEKEREKYPDLQVDVASFRQMTARYWAACVEEVDRADQAFALSKTGRLFELRYEDLCADPDAALWDLAAFMDCDPGAFDLSAFSVANANRKVGQPTHEKWAGVVKTMEKTLKKKGYA
jgi:hypothetical protein